jgi:nitrate reductase NapAB chaperone NapD
MYDKYVIVQTEPQSLKQVGSKLNEFEGVVHETQLLSHKSAILARVVTDNEQRFRNFIREQLKPMNGVIKIQGVSV